MVAFNFFSFHFLTRCLLILLVSILKQVPTNTILEWWNQGCFWSHCNVTLEQHTALTISIMCNLTTYLPFTYAFLFNFICFDTVTLELWTVAFLPYRPVVYRALDRLESGTCMPFSATKPSSSYQVITPSKVYFWFGHF